MNIDKKLDTFRVRLTSWCYVSIAKQRKGWEVMATTREQELLFINFEFKRAKKNMCLWHPHSNLRVRVSKMFERNRHCHTNRQDSDSSVDGVHHTYKYLSLITCRQGRILVTVFFFSTWTRMTDLDRVKYLDSILVPLRGFDGHGHFKTLLVSLRRRALYEILEKHPNLKGQVYGLFL